MVMVANQLGTEVGFLAGRYPGRVGHLHSPGRAFVPFDFLPYALDNGAFVAHVHGTAWDVAEWRRLLLCAAMQGQRPLWALVPDVVADKAATLELYEQHVDEVRRYGFRPAFAVQDGMTFDDVPDGECVVFIGGSTEFKEAAIAPWCARFPGRVHVGRVNDADRLLRCYRAGAVSVDGTGWFRNNSRAKRTGGHTAGVLLRRFLAETTGDRA